MNKAFNFLIVAALVLGVVCVVLITKYVDARVKQARANAPTEEVVLKKVLTAKTEIKVGSEFTSFNTEIKSMPEKFVPTTAVGSLEELNGKVALYVIPEQDLILTSKSGDPSQLPKPSTVVKAGQRLVTIRVDDEKAAGYTVKNGDFVDLVGLFKITPDMLDREESPMGDTLAVTFLQRVQVFDIIYGQEEDEGSQDQNKNGGGENPAESSTRMARGTTATFQVTPSEANIILSADQTAEKISMVLRRYDDTAVIKPPSDLHKKIITKLTGDLKGEEVVATPEPVTPAEPKSFKRVF